jgi:hypothetical protein
MWQTSTRDELRPSAKRSRYLRKLTGDKYFYINNCFKVKLNLTAFCISNKQGCGSGLT